MAADPAAESDADGLRVALLIADAARRRELVAALPALGHSVASLETSDVVLTDDATMVEPGLAVVLLGEGAAAAGILPPDADLAQIDAALRAVAVGLVVRPAPRFFDADDGVPLPLLTPREVEILVALRDGLSNKAIARRLAISQHTVKFHAESIFRKLGVTNRVEAVAKGLRRGLVHL
ncbi:MAG TPA: response regulator transcription factor [Rhizomicrobium sp.]|nr:response regulator transcription factor [Rhizomicrobium sp.]